MHLTIQEILGASNIAEMLDESDKEEIVGTVLEHYYTDEASRDDWADHYLKVLEMAGQKVEVKNKPWKGAANVKYPVMVQAALQFNARVVPALIPNAEPVGAGKVGIDPDGQKTQIARLVANHMNYQLTSEMEEWEHEMDNMLMSLGISGMEYKKTIFDASLGRNVSRHVSPLNLCINYYADDMATCRKTEIHRWTKNQIIEKINAGQFLPVDWEKLAGPALGDQDDVLARREEDNGRSEPSVADSATPYTVLEYHGFWDMDGDGYEEPYVITVMEHEETLLSILPRFGEEGMKTRDNGAITKIEPYDVYTRYILLPSPDNSFYGMGYGHLLYPINSAVNTAINQLLDSGTMANMQSGFVGRNVNMKGGMNALSPGKWININASGDDLRKGIIPLPTKEPSNVLFSLMSYLVEASEKLSSTTDVFTGEHPGQNTKVGVTQAVREEGQKVFTAIYKRLRRSLRKELIALYELNAIVLSNDPNKETKISKSAEAFQVSAEFYSIGGMVIQPTADPNLAIKEQRLAKDTQALEMIMQTGIGNLPAAMRRTFHTMEIENVDELLPQDAAPPPNPEAELEQAKMQQAASQADFDAMMEQERFEHQKEVDIMKLKLEQLKLSLDNDKMGTQIGTDIAKMDKDRQIAEANNEAKRQQQQQQAANKGAAPPSQ